MPEISISVCGKIAQVHGNPMIVCGNSDYTLNVDLDSEWDGIENITVHFQYLRDGQPMTESLPLTNGQCAVPVICGTCAVLVGISGGNIRTATPAVIPCLPCCTDLHGTEKQPVRDVYNEIMEVIANA